MAIPRSNSANANAGRRRLLRTTIILGVAGLLGSLVLNLATHGNFNWVTGAVAFPFGVAVATISHKLRSAKDDESERGGGGA